MIYAYVRETLRIDKREEMIEIMKPYNIDKWYIDDTFDKAIKKNEYKKMLASIKPNDTLIIYDFCSIAKSVIELADIIMFFKGKNIKLKSIRNDFDSGNVESEKKLKVIVELSNFEKEALLNRQKEGIEYARLEGKNIGRNPIKIEKQLFDVTYNKYMRREITKIEFSEMISVTRPTLDKFIKAYETNGITEHNGFYCVDARKRKDA